MEPSPVHRSVLVVDDHALVRNLVVRILEEAGLTVLAVESGLDAIDCVQQRPGEIGCVLQDLSMPDMRGEKVIGRIHEIDPDLPVVAFSAEDEYSAAERLSGLSIASYVQKPFDIKALVELILGLTSTM